MAELRIPLSTYRIQFNSNFRFEDATAIVSYLHKLGITDLYSSPHFKARTGSSHGYDIANPMRTNPELGREEELNNLLNTLRQHGMGIVLDIVPNHLAASHENPWWMDVLENGQASEYAKFFDIDWHPAASKAAFLQENKVLLPILHDLYGNVLHNQQLTLQMEDGRLFIRYFDHKLPFDLKTYGPVLEHCLLLNPEMEIVREALVRIADLPSRDDPDEAQVRIRRGEKGRIAEMLRTAWQTIPAFRRAAEETMRYFNGSAGHPRTFDMLDDLLSQQAFRLAYWKIGPEETNYRRFFDINELVGLRVELPEVFNARHVKILDLVRSGKVTGLRIDHVDGLHDPAGYLRRLQETIAAEPSFYVVVEKILSRGEALPPTWQVNGTTGYDFLNALNDLFIYRPGLDRLTKDYARRTGENQPFAEVSYASAKKVMAEMFVSEVNALGHALGELAAQDRQARDIPLSELMQILVEVTACLPVYRTYINSFEISESDRACIESTLELARRRTSPDLNPAGFDFLHRVLLLNPPYYAEQQRQEWLDFVMRWQQFTGPVMAKGLEDTACYRYNVLLSLNEVGGDPLRQKPPGDIAEFHDLNRCRQAHWAGSLNATSTHDTKRGEDARARINVLSEIPEEWESRLDHWMRLNQYAKRNVRGALAPSVSEEIMLYQALIGSWPFDPQEQEEFPERFREYAAKALREAKIHSNWLAPDEFYEGAVQDFIGAILQRESPFFKDFLVFHARVAFFGAINSLGQVLFKITSPGVPDFYQGSELWNFSMVDPDNRRPVDYRRRTNLLNMIRKQSAQAAQNWIAELAADPCAEATKIFLTHRALQFRNANAELFQRGEYIPLQAAGPHAENVCAFARRHGQSWAISIAPRWLATLKGPPAFDLNILRGATLVVPRAAPARWRNVLTGSLVEHLSIADILSAFPVALLHNES